jgi:CspA family cold shock protein
VQTGIIKWLNRRKGFVLIEPDSGCADVLLHVTAIDGATPEGLRVGQRVQFETIARAEKLSARNFSTVVPFRHG